MSTSYAEKDGIRLFVHGNAIIYYIEIVCSNTY